MSAKGGRGSGGGKRDSILELAKVRFAPGSVECHSTWQPGEGAQPQGGSTVSRCRRPDPVFSFVFSEACRNLLTIDHFLLQLIDQNVRVKCLGGRELRGALRGYDELVNLVLDDCDEFIRGWSGVEILYSGCVTSQFKRKAHTLIVAKRFK